MDNNKLNGLYSWPAIIVLFIFFWPAGLFCLYKRAQYDKQTALTAAKILKFIGVILIIFGVATIVAVVGIVYIIGGIALIVMSKKLLASAENVKKYLAIVVNGNVRQLDAISSAVGKPYDTVKKDIQKMIDDGYFKNAYIKEDTREIVLAQAQCAYADTFAVSAKVVTCPCCGANNTVMGVVGECEYCGAPLK